ncbi:15-hydroxyprostaglandin dehydrogenase [NAD(+)] [Halyomorpha halys]|uniref:15-hydroxyprostaglandin dehydrogenase [NAD(+)] n=1 Tax=Halyomorpha halys TaxID=286706 RepID=UPI0006D4E524
MCNFMKFMRRFLWTNAMVPGGAVKSRHGISFWHGNCNFLKPGTRNQRNIIRAKCHSTSDIPCKKYLDVKCKIALVTGGNTGIGLAIAETLLANGLQKAYISGIDNAAGVNALLMMNYKYGDGRCDYIPIDVNNYKQFEDAFKYITCRDGGVDILVNNAGMLNDESWELQFDTNVKGVIRGSLLANKYMPTQKNRGGVVVNVSSILGFDTFPYAPGYNSTKHAVIGLTRSFGDVAKFRSNQVRHIAIGPGVTGTELIYESGSRMLTEDWGRKTYAALNSLPYQTTDPVGRGTLYTIEYGPPGSLWIIEDCLLERIIPPKRQSYQIKVKDL